MYLNLWKVFDGSCTALEPHAYIYVHTYVDVCRHHIYIHVQSGYLSIALEPLDSQTQPTTNRKLRYSLLIRQTDSGHMPLRGDGRGSKKEDTTIKTSLIHRKKKKKWYVIKNELLGPGKTRALTYVTILFSRIFRTSMQPTLSCKLTYLPHNYQVPSTLICASEYT